jgi:hypothetical protein
MRINHGYLDFYANTICAMARIAQPCKSEIVRQAVMLAHAMLDRRKTCISIKINFL